MKQKVRTVAIIAAVITGIAALVAPFGALAHHLHLKHMQPPEE